MMIKYIKYLLIGGSAFFAEYISFFIINELTKQLFAAQIISWCIGYIISFSGHRRITFNEQTGYKFSKNRQFVLYGLAAIMTLVISTILIIMLSKFLTPNIAKLLVMIINASISYLFLNRLVFIRQ